MHLLKFHGSLCQPKYSHNQFVCETLPTFHISILRMFPFLPVSVALFLSLSCSLFSSRTFFAASFLVADEGNASYSYRMIPSCILLHNCHYIVFFELCTNWTRNLKFRKRYLYHVHPFYYIFIKTQPHDVECQYRFD